MTIKQRKINLKIFSGIALILMLLILTSLSLESTHASQLIGDVNDDGAVNISDLAIMAAHWGLSSGATLNLGDLNNDGAVNIEDLAILASHWEDTSAGLPAIPTGLSAAATSSNSVNLAWNSENGSNGTINYIVYRNDTEITSTTNTSYSDSNLSSDNSYSYTIAASDSYGLSDQTSAENATTQVGPAGAPGNWALALDDEFTQDSTLNTSLWYAYDNVVQNDTNMYASNVNFSGGDLNLEASGAAGASGALIETNPDDEEPGHTGYQYTYGFAEADIYLPPSGNEVANWPAWWALGQDWPEDGEMDILEGLSGSACYHFHYGSSGDPQASGGCASGNFSGWHTFGADWEPGTVTYYYDGVDVGQTTYGVTSEPMYLVLENSTGQCGTGGVCDGPHMTPADMLVSYVRVWQQ
jgi:hypothetical protein